MIIITHCRALLCAGRSSHSILYTSQGALEGGTVLSPSPFEMITLRPNPCSLAAADLTSHCEVTLPLPQLPPGFACGAFRCELSFYLLE